MCMYVHIYFFLSPIHFYLLVLIHDHGLFFFFSVISRLTIALIWCRSTLTQSVIHEEITSTRIRWIIRKQIRKSWIFVRIYKKESIWIQSLITPRRCSSAILNIAATARSNHWKETVVRGIVTLPFQLKDKARMEPRKNKLKHFFFLNVDQRWDGQKRNFKWYTRNSWYCYIYEILAASHLPLNFKAISAFFSSLYWQRMTVNMPIWPLFDSQKLLYPYTWHDHLTLSIDNSWLDFCILVPYSYFLFDVH